MRIAAIILSFVVLQGCTEEPAEIDKKLMEVSERITDIEVANSVRVALVSGKPADVASAFVYSTAYILGNSDSSAAQCYSKAIGLSGGVAAMTEVISKAFAVIPPAYELAESQARQIKLTEVITEQVFDPHHKKQTWLEELQYEVQTVINAVNGSYKDGGKHVLTDWLVCAKL